MSRYDYEPELYKAIISDPFPTEVIIEDAINEEDAYWKVKEVYTESYNIRIEPYTYGFDSCGRYHAPCETLAQKTRIAGFPTSEQCYLMSLGESPFWHKEHPDEQKTFNDWMCKDKTYSHINGYRQDDKQGI